MDEIKQLIAETFNQDINEIDEDASPSTVEGWDSLGHFQLVYKIEEKYNIMLNTNDIFQITNMKEIIEVLKKYGKHN